jgi:hypothetical protein
MGVEALAAAVVAKLLVPLLSKGADKLTDGLSESMANGVASRITDVAQTAWSKVKAAFTAEEQPLLKTIEERPEKSAPLLTDLLKDKLEQQPELAEELEKLLAEQPAGETHSVGTIMGEYVGYVDASGSTINAPVTGLSMNAPQAPASQRSSEG